MDAAALADRYPDLPLLFLHWGRSDQTVAFYGANVTPAAADIQEVVFRADRARVSVVAELRDGAR